MEEYYYWLICGIILILKDSFLLNSVFVLTIGIAALIVAALIAINIISSSNYILQFGIFVAFASCFCVLVFIKRKIKTHQKFNDVIGNKANIFEGPITASNDGKLSWSGTIVKAKISPKANKAIFEIGEQVEIVLVEGNIFYIKEVS